MSESKPALDIIYARECMVLLYRHPIRFTLDDKKYLKTKGVLVIESPNLAADIHSQTVRSHESTVSAPRSPAGDLELMDVLVGCIGYNKDTFATKVLNMLQRKIADAKNANAKP